MVQQPVNEFQLLLKALGYLRTHWWLFLLEVLFIYGNAFHRYYRTDPVYQSTTSILIDNSRRQMYQNYMLGSSSSAARKQNMAHLLTSEDVYQRVRRQLTDIYNAEGRPPYLRALFPGGEALPVYALRETTSLHWDKSSDIYVITCSAINADAAHDLCLAYLNTIQSYYPEIGQREIMMKRDFLSRQIASLTRQIAEREASIADFQKRAPEFLRFLMLDREEQGGTKLRAELAKLSETLTANRAMKELLMKGPAAKRGEHVALQPAIQALTARVTELRYQIKLTEQSNNPEKEARLAELSAQLGEAERQLASLNEEETASVLRAPITSSSARDKIASLELDYRVGLIRRATLERKIEELNQQKRKFQQQQLEYDRLNADLTHRKRLLQNLYSKEQQTELELSAGGAEIFRLQEPTRNNFRVAPLLSRYFYGSLSVSIFILAVSVVLLMAAFPRLDSEADVNRLNLPVIGKVPQLRRMPHAFGESGIDIEYLKIMNYRILRETKDTPCPIVLISSARAREGKSTVAQLLASASESSDRRTLLIDGDLLTAHPNRFFGIAEDQTAGLNGLISGTAGPIENLIVKTIYEGVSFLPRGTRLSSSPGPNFLKPIEGTLQQLRKQYDLILIDTPPLFASNLAHQFSGIAHLIVIVGRLFVTRPKDLTEALQTCRIFSKAPVGVALNCVPLSVVDRRVSNY